MSVLELSVIFILIVFIIHILHCYIEKKLKSKSLDVENVLVNNKFSKYICVKSHYHFDFPYTKGHEYFFHEDESPGSEFVLVVDHRNYPEKIITRPEE